MSLDPHLILLCQEYVDIVAIHTSPTLDSDERQAASVARTDAHEQLLAYTRLTRTTVDYAWARNVVRSSKTYSTP